MSDEEKRKFHNPTPGYVGAVIYNEENKKEGVPVEPGGDIWLSPAEERATAEAPRSAADNPFTKSWEQAVEWDSDGFAIRYEPRSGVLVLSDEAPRPIASDRFIPSAAQPAAEEEPVTPEPPAVPPVEEEQVGADVPKPQGPPPEGTPAPNEVVATPEAVAANDAELAARARDAEEPTPVIDRPAGPDQIGVQKAPPLPV